MANENKYCPVCKGDLKPFNAVRECKICGRRFFIIQTSRKKKE